MLRAFGKTCFAAAYTVTRAAQRVSKRRETVPLPFIVCYHRVVEDFDRTAQVAIPSMLISAAMLERHIDWLARRFTIVSLDEIGSHLQSRRPFRRPAAAITFDDGYSDVYQHGLPLLKRKGVPAAVFVVTDLIGTGRPQIFDRLYLLLRLIQSQRLPLAGTVQRAMQSLDVQSPALQCTDPADEEPFQLMTLLLKGLPQEKLELIMSALERTLPFDRSVIEQFSPLTWQMIETMNKSDITIGSHTKSHILLTAETLDTARQELIESKDVLESKLKTRIRHFAYPDGRFNPAVVEAVDSSGYEFAYGICRMRDAQRPLLTIPRKVLWERACLNAWGRFSPSVMTCQADAVFDSDSQCEHDHKL
jgi:peptidoglycan/xylan/chitin deacetylase (PgdA/CDA1 family)